MTHISEENFHKYIFQFSLELSAFAKEKDLYFISYLIDMIHVESAKSIGIYPFDCFVSNNNFLEKDKYNLSDSLLIIYQFSEALYKMTISKNLSFMRFIFGVISFEIKNMIELRK